MWFWSGQKDYLFTKSPEKINYLLYKDDINVLARNEKKKRTWYPNPRDRNFPTEEHYSQIEKEALGIIFAVTKLHRYLHGRFFTLQRDQKPLITIFGSKKGLPIYTANRLLRWWTILLNYNFKIEYLPSKQISHADVEMDFGIKKYVMLMKS